MDTKLIKQKILDLAIRGKLVPQNPADEPASVLLERIKAEKALLIKEGKIKKEKPLAPIEEIPFEIPESWCIITLKELAFVGTGATPSKNKKDYYGGNIAWISSGATKDSFICKPTDYITIKALTETNCQVYPIGTLIMAMYGEGKTRGQVSELSIEACTNQACAAIIPIVPETKQYIKIYLQSQYFYLRALAEGGNQPNLNLNKIASYLVPFPPLEEQKRIVAEIDRWFKWIDELEQNQQDLHTAIKQAKSKILDLAIHGKLVPQESKWKEYELKEVCDFLSGYAFDSNEYKTSGIPLVRISNIKNSGIDLEQCVFIQKSIEDRFIIKKGDLLIAMSGATTGKMGIYRLDSDAALNQRVGNLRVKDTSLLLPEYRDLYMLAQQELILKLAYGGAQPNISAKNISSFKISLPTIVEQKIIIIKTQSLFAQLDCIEKCLG